MILVFTLSPRQGIMEGFLVEVTPRGKSCWARRLRQGKEHRLILAFSAAAPGLWATEAPSETAEESKVQSGQGAHTSLQDGKWQNQVCLTLMSVQSGLEAGAAAHAEALMGSDPCSWGNFQQVAWHPWAYLAHLQSGVTTICPMS